MKHSSAIGHLARLALLWVALVTSLTACTQGSPSSPPDTNPPKVMAASLPSRTGTGVDTTIGGAAQPTAFGCDAGALLGFAEGGVPVCTTAASSYTAAGDLSGSSSTQTVVGIQTRPVATTAPTSGQALEWSGSAWAPASIAGGFTAAGDLSGSNTSQTVVGLEGRSVSSSAPTTNQLLAWNGSSWAPTASSVVATGGWINSTLGTNGTCDFSTQTTTTLTTDGNYTFCGITMVKANSANETTPMVVTNGTGVTIVPSSSTQFNAGVRTAPLLNVPFINVIPGYTTSTPVKICVDWVSQNVNADFDECFVGVDTGGTALNWRAGYTHNSTLGQQLTFTVLSTGGTVETSSAGAADPVTCLTFPSGVATEMASYETSPTAYTDAGVWPTPLVRSGILSVSYSAGSTAFPALSAYSATMGAQRQASATALSCKAKSILLQYR